MTCATRRANSTIASRTPAATPSARLPVATVTATVTAMTGRFRHRHPLQRCRRYAVPVHGFDRDNHHHGGQRHHRYLRHQAREAGHQQQQHQRCDRRRHAGARPADFDVDHGLPDHGASGDAAVEARDDVGDAERPGFPALVRARIRQIVDQLCRQQRFQQPHEGDAERGRPDDPQAFPDRAGPETA